MKDSKDTRKFAIYSRKSMFTGKGESIANQIELCRQYLFQKYSNITDDDIVVFEDEGFSGKNTNRPEFQKMMKAVRAKQIRAVVCYRLDRISRSVADFANIYEELDSLNVMFVSYSENYDSNTPMGRAMLQMAAVFAQMERETIAERIRDNKYALARMGRWLGGCTPHGYKSIPITGSVSANGRERKAYSLSVVDEEAKVVKLMFRKFIEWGNLTKLEQYLEDNQMRSRNGNRFWFNAIKAILTNPVYMIADEDAWNYFENKGASVYMEKSEFDGLHGIIAYSKTTQNAKGTNETRDISDWIIAVGQHEGLVCGKDWIKVQNILELNRSKYHRKPKENSALLSGLLICGNCGGYMRPKNYNRILENGDIRFGYLCETKEKSHRYDCDIKNPNGNELDRMICEEIKKLSDENSEFLKMLGDTKKLVNKNSDDYTQQIKTLQDRLAMNGKKINTLLDKLSETDEITSGYVNDKIKELHQDNENIKIKIEELDALNKKALLSDTEFDFVKDMMLSFAESFDRMSVEQKRRALRTFIKRIIWDGKNVRVCFFGSKEDEDAEMDLPSDILPPLYDGSKEPQQRGRLIFPRLTISDIERRSYRTFSRVRERICISNRRSGAITV